MDKEMDVLDIESREIKSKFRSLMLACKTCKSKEDKANIKKAFQLAVKAHKDMRRRSGEPYVYHPIEVAHICVSEMGLGPTSVICALLHDVVEDTEYTLSDIESMFDEKVARIIDGLTKISGLFEQGDIRSAQAENFKKMLYTLADDVRVILIKLADRLHNMRTLDAMPENKQLKIASETLYLFAPLAHRLGFYAVKSEYEDLSMKYTQPEIYKSIETKLLESKEERDSFIRSFILPIKRDLKKQGFEFEVTGRTKSIFSIWSKMRKKGIPFEEVYDLFAIRIIIDTNVDMEKVDCWKAYSIVTDVYTPRQDRLRDWISVPKANGYSSLHTTVMSKSGKWVEVQIRSGRMDEIADKGFAAHWKYKGDGPSSERGLDDWLKRIRELLTNPDSDALDFLDDFKLHLFSDEIFVFSPKGDTFHLPKGATALDFAYAIHSEIGNHCIAAKVNYKLVPLRHVLKSGDQVEIITSSKQNPKDEWFDYVITAKAKSFIKDAIKEVRKTRVDEGKEILHKLFEQAKLDFSKTNIQQFQRYVGIQSTIDFYYLIAIGKIGLKELKQSCTEDDKSNWLRKIRKPFGKTKTTESRPLPEVILEQLRDPNFKFRHLLSDDIEKIDYEISECCKPIPGDEVVAVIDENKKIKIHRINCAEAINLMSKFGNRIVKAKWTSKENIGFLVGVEMNGIDKKGLINEMTYLISQEYNVNIKSFKLESNSGMFSGEIFLYVNDAGQLQHLIQTIGKLDGVKNISRMD